MNEARHMGAALNRADLDPAMVDDLFGDLATCATIQEVLIKAAAGDHARSGTGTLDEALLLLRAGRVRGVQIRYRWQGREWCDTLLVMGGTVHLVRIGGEDQPGVLGGP